MGSFAASLFGKANPAFPLDTVAAGVVLPNKTTVAATGAPQVSVLSNGMKVVTQSSHIPITTMGVLVDVGSRYEDSSVNGITNFTERMILKSTVNRPTFRLYRDMSKLGADLGATSSREHLILTAQTASEVNPVLGALADLVSNPAFTFNEIQHEIEAYKKDSEGRGQMYDVTVNDAVHTAAFGAEGLGASMYAHDSTLEHFDTNTLATWHRTFFTPKRMVISAIGVDHEKFVELCEEMFHHVPKDNEFVPKVPAAYLGGDVRMTDRSYKGLTHVVLGFNAPSWTSEDVYAASVLQMLLGGGGSFSAGGPGKGLYSRLYQNVLNKYNWVDSAVSFNSIYSDAGLFGVYGTAPAEAAGALAEVLGAEMKNAGNVTEEEVARSKNLLKSSVVSFLENSTSRVEEMARFVQMFGEYNPATLVKKIDAVTVDDVSRVAKKLLESPISVATYGDASKVPRKIVF